MSYSGTNYHGWQKQPDAMSVQEKINFAFSTALQTEIDVVGAGRTDTGVHATKYFAHFDIEFELQTIEQLIFRLNTILPKDIAVQNIFEVHPEAHARFDAESRTYQYFVVQQKDPFAVENSYYIKNQLDLDKMREASKLLFNHKNFKSFSKVKTDVYTFDCEIYEAFWTDFGNRLQFQIKANRFLRNMVRAIVGTLIQVGLHKVSVEDFNNIILSQDRREAGKSVPAHALFLTDISYPKYIIQNS